MGVFGQDGAAVEWRGRHETVRIEPWGADSLRARGTVRQSVRDDLPGALLPSPPPPGARTVITPDLARITSGRLTAEITAGGRLRFLRTSDGAELLAEVVPHFVGPPQRRCAPTGPGSGLHHVEVLFGARDGERFYGLGQHQHGKLDQKGAVIELVQRNTEVSIPFLLSSLGYGFLWNHPVFSPLCRLHGSRQPATMLGAEDTGAPNGLWSFGAEAYEILRRWLRLRERLRPYVMGTMRVARTEGLAPFGDISATSDGT